MQFINQFVKLSPLTSADLDFLYNMEINPLVYRYEAEHAPSKEEAYEKYGKKIARMQEKPDQFLIFLISALPEEKPVGHIQIQLNWENTREWEIGYFLHPDDWGKGYVSEAARLLIKYVFENLQAHKVIAFCNANNVKSAKVMERINMTREGRLREGRILNNTWCDEFIYSILDREFFAMNL